MNQAAPTEIGAGQALNNADTCYHCGEAVPDWPSYRATIGGIDQAMCCPGCKAVAELIDSSGMAQFYQQRTAFNDKPLPADSADNSQFQAYDLAELQATFTTVDAHGNATASLLLGGISCAACTWLIETSLGKIPGVIRSNVSLQHSKLEVAYDPQLVKTSALFAKVSALGYAVQPYEASVQRDQLITENRRDLRRLAVAWLGMMQVGMFGIALHAGDLQGMAVEYQSLLRWVSLLVASFVVYFSARPFFESAWRHLRQGALVMDLPVALAIGIAWLASAVATMTGRGQVYFDSVVMFTALLLLARYFEHSVRRRDNLDWLDVQSNLPLTVTLRQGDSWTSALRQSLTSGASVLIKPGATIPVDGEIMDGDSAVDEQTFTGEQLPRAVGVGDAIFAGTVNLEGALEVRASGNFADTRLARLQRSSQLGRQGKPELAQLADRLASKFVAAILLITCSTALVWSFIDPSRALWVALSVLVISCPCALSLATPSALASAAAALRRSGIMVSGDNALASLAQTTHLVCDKTGTLTEGKFSIERIVILGSLSEDTVLSTAACLQQYSNHPIAQAFKDSPARNEATEVDYVVGAGIAGTLNDCRYRMGSEAFCRELQTSLPAPPDTRGYWIALVSEQQVLAWIDFNDPLREEATAVLQQAKKQGLTLIMLTGDSGQQGQYLAARLGIEDFQTGLSPEQKMARVEQLQDTGAVVTMVGDGLNDAPVLARANTSIAMANAADLTRTQADLVIVDGGLETVTLAMQKAKFCRRVVLQNFAWALAYNLCAIPLAVSGMVAPWMAAVGMSLSSLLVVANSLRLNRHH
ncbi:MAG: heavy metal translocating P-type ATPase [Halioglobus sp.]